MNCQFAFGPNRSFFCAAGPIRTWSENNLPSGLLRVLQDSRLEITHDVALPMESGLHAASWKTTGGQDGFDNTNLGPTYARLARFIQTTSGHTLRTVFGANSSYFSISSSGYSWQNIPAALEEQIHNCMSIRRPTCVALGVQGSYIALFNDGTVSFDLRGGYPLVDGMIRNAVEAARRGGIMYIALNPFVPGEYYGVFGDGSASWNFPTAWSENVTFVSRHIRRAATEPSGTQSSPGGLDAASPGGTAPVADVLPDRNSVSQLPTPSTSPVVAPRSVSIPTASSPTIAHTSPPLSPSTPTMASISPSSATAASAPAQRPPVSSKNSWQKNLSKGLKVANKVVRVLPITLPGAAQASSTIQNTQSVLNIGSTLLNTANAGQVQGQDTTTTMLNMGAALFNAGARNSASGTLNAGAALLNQVNVDQQGGVTGTTQAIVDLFNQNQTPGDMQTDTQVVNTAQAVLNFGAAVLDQVGDKKGGKEDKLAVGGSQPVVGVVESVTVGVSDPGQQPQVVVQETVYSVGTGGVTDVEGTQVTVQVDN
ncbi:hypothetical protein FB45DRAFT_320115 [Roridomyces roridus]|uniref:Uncharacterized protein n=1 Tax=Roridomyces roridus TaxID=1738132 RepID=A0AAD7B629_9AGAR|nr:hypothetical protein FB45DRAFT_320115 [Roridomyces roridus]